MVVSGCPPSSTHDDGNNNGDGNNDDGNNGDGNNGDIFYVQ
jgi:hypothetical protein